MKDYSEGILFYFNKDYNQFLKQVIKEDKDIEKYQIKYNKGLRYIDILDRAQDIENLLMEHIKKEKLDLDRADFRIKGLIKFLENNLDLLEKAQSQNLTGDDFQSIEKRFRIPALYISLEINLLSGVAPDISFYGKNYKKFKDMYKSSSGGFMPEKFDSNKSLLLKQNLFKSYFNLDTITSNILINEFLKLSQNEINRFVKSLIYGLDSLKNNIDRDIYFKESKYMVSEKVKFLLSALEITRGLFLELDSRTDFEIDKLCQESIFLSLILRTRKE